MAVYVCINVDFSLRNSCILFWGHQWIGIHDIVNEVYFEVWSSLVIEFLLTDYNLLLSSDTAIFAELEGVINHLLVESCSIWRCDLNPYYPQNQRFSFCDSFVICYYNHGLGKWYFTRSLSIPSHIPEFSNILCEWDIHMLEEYRTLGRQKVSITFFFVLEISECLVKLLKICFCIEFWKKFLKRWKVKSIFRWRSVFEV